VIDYRKATVDVFDRTIEMGHGSAPTGAHTIAVNVRSRNISLASPGYEEQFTRFAGVRETTAVRSFEQWYSFEHGGNLGATCHGAASDDAMDAIARLSSTHYSSGASSMAAQR